MVREADGLPRAIEVALRRLPKLPKGTKDFFAYLGLKPAREEPLAKEGLGRVHSFWERWDVGFGSKYVLEFSGYYPPGYGGVSIFSDITLLRKLPKPGADGRAEYRELPGGQWKRSQPGPQQLLFAEEGLGKDLPPAIQEARKRLPNITGDTKDIFAALALERASGAPVATEGPRAGPNSSFWQRWEVGLGAEFVLELSGDHPAENPKATSFSNVALLRKVPKPNGDDEEPEYRELPGGHWNWSDAKPERPQ